MNAKRIIGLFLLVVFPLLQTGCVYFDKKSTPSIHNLNDVLPKALAGDSQAQVALADAFNSNYSSGGLGKDPMASLRYLLEIAEMGNPRAQYTLADLYRNGGPQGGTDSLRIQPDRSKARYWFERAAEQGYRLAYSGLQQFYGDVNQPEADLVEACKWALLQSPQTAYCTSRGLNPEQVGEARARVIAWQKAHPERKP